MKFCVDCKWFRQSRMYQFSSYTLEPLLRCVHDAVGSKPDLVTKERRYPTCHKTRSWLAPCGPNAKLFEPKINEARGD